MLFIGAAICFVLTLANGKSLGYNLSRWVVGTTVFMAALILAAKLVGL